MQKQLSIIRNNFPQMESSGYPSAEIFWLAAHSQGSMKMSNDLSAE
jgi:hypothetical protein